MSRLQLEIIDSVSALRAWQPAWDDLWQRSEVTYPTAQAGPLADWLQQFRPRAPFKGLLVRREEQLLAAWPLVAARVARVLDVGSLTSDDWSPGGDLLIDPQTDIPAVTGMLVRGLRRLPWPALWLQAVETEQPWWQALLRAVQAAGVPHASRERFSVGFIDTHQSWEAYRARWSPNHQQHVARCARRLAELWPVRYEQIDQPTAAELPQLLRRVFEMEDRGWKGRAGTSVLRAPGMFDFYQRQAVALAANGQLAIALLWVGERPAAFLYGFRAKGVLHWLKSGYDEALGRCSPGQLLLGQMLEAAHRNPAIRLVDLMGVVNSAMSRWLPRTSPVARVLIAPNRLWGTSLTAAYDKLWPRLSAWRQAFAAGANQATIL